VHQAYLDFKFVFTLALISKQYTGKVVLEIFGDTAGHRGTDVPPLDKIFVQDVYTRRHECLDKI
jgi:hypothetical protein